MENTKSPRFGLEAHQVFWNERGSIVCACYDIPYPGSDTWVWERWEEITPEMMAEIDREGGHVACEGCGKEPRRIVRSAQWEGEARWPSPRARGRRRPRLGSPPSRRRRRGRSAMNSARSRSA